MTEAIYRIAASVGTPLALAGVTVALFSRIALAVIKKLAAGRPEDTAPVLKRMLDLFFILSLVATILGGVAWFCAKYIDPPTPKTGALAPRNRGPVRSDSGCAMKFDTHSGVLHFYAPIGVALLPLGPNVPLWIVKSPAGLLINAEVKSMDGKIMAELVDNEWRVNPHNYFNLNFDKSSLEIIDDYNIPWLQIDYLTGSSLRIGGVFRTGEDISPKAFPNFTNVAFRGSVAKVVAGHALIIGNGQMVLDWFGSVESEAQKQALASKLREIVEPWFDYAPSKGLGVKLPPEPQVTTNPLKVQIPTSAVSGELGGQPFTCGNSMVFGSTLFLSQDSNFPPVTGLSITLPLKLGEPIAGKSFVVTNRTEDDRYTSISLDWSVGGARKSDSLAENFVLFVEFGTLNGSQIPGKFYLESSRKKRTKAVGSFFADVR